jgi:hypothetical protein
MTPLHLFLPECFPRIDSAGDCRSMHAANLQHLLALSGLPADLKIEAARNVT